MQIKWHDMLSQAECFSDADNSFSVSLILCDLSWNTKVFVEKLYHEQLIKSIFCRSQILWLSWKLNKSIYNSIIVILEALFLLLIRRGICI